MIARTALASMLCAATLAVAEDAGTTVRSISFDDAPADAQPPTGNAAAQLSDVEAKGNDAVLVAGSAEGFDGKALKLVKASAEGYSPRATIRLDDAKDGKLRIEWKSGIEAFTAGEHFNKNQSETLHAVNLLNTDGRAVASIRYVARGDGGGGGIAVKNAKAKLPKWELGKPHTFVIDADLAAGTYVLNIDGKTVAEAIEIEGEKPLRTIEFRDGSGFGGADGRFTAVVDDIRVTRNP